LNTAISAGRQNPATTRKAACQDNWWAIGKAISGASIAAALAEPSQIEVTFVRSWAGNQMASIRLLGAQSSAKNNPKTRFRHHISWYVVTRTMLVDRTVTPAPLIRSRRLGPIQSASAPATSSMGA
jgi:hypothetical protein